MKLFLFKAIAFAAGSLASINMKIGNSIAKSIVFFFNGVNWIIQSIGAQLMTIVDKDRFEHAKTALAQLPELKELDLLMAASKVKDDAIKNRTWTVNHTIAMNQISNALYAQCRWEPARIHQYLKQVVESVPGMVYMGGDDFED